MADNKKGERITPEIAKTIGQTVARIVPALEGLGLSVKLSTLACVMADAILNGAPQEDFEEIIQECDRFLRDTISQTVQLRAGHLGKGH